MMQGYYRTAKAVTQLNTLLLQNFEVRLTETPDVHARGLNERFAVRGELLEATHEKRVPARPVTPFSRHFC